MGEPKALLTLNGETFLDRLIGLFQPYCTEVLVVLGHDAERVRSAATRPASFIYNADHALGQLSSLQCGMRALPADVEAVFFTPLDYPAIKPGTVDAVLKAIGPSDDAAAPEYHGRHGHPVLIRAALIPRLLELPADRTAREVMHRSVIRYVEVDDLGTVQDVDDPAAYRALLEVAS
jgi:molybdenum cofactor cytidylyltransferase